MAGRTTKKVTEEQPKKATATKKTTSKKEVVDSTAVEVPMEEPKIDIKEVNRDQEVIQMITDRFYNLGDAEKESAAKIFSAAKEQLKDSYSEENVSIIAASATDAAILAMMQLRKDSIRQIMIENATTLREQRKLEREKARDERRRQRDLQSAERRKNREERRARLGILSGNEV